MLDQSYSDCLPGKPLHDLEGGSRHSEQIMQSKNGYPCLSDCHAARAAGSPPCCWEIPPGLTTEEMEGVIYKLIVSRAPGEAAKACPLIVKTGGLRLTEIGALARRLELGGVDAILVVSSKPGVLAYIAKKLKNSATLPDMIKFLLVPLADMLQIMSERVCCRLVRRI